MPFSNTIISQRMTEQSSGPDNDRPVAPGHWKREEDNYLTQIGAMHYINKDPMARAGYAYMQNPDGSGLELSGEGPLAARIIEKIFGGEVEGAFSPVFSTMFAKPDTTPTRYGEVLTHELGHAGSFSTGNASFWPGEEEKRQRMVDFFMHPRTSDINDEAQQFLQNQYGLYPLLAGPQTVSQYVPLANEWGVKYPDKSVVPSKYWPLMTP